MGAWGRRGVRAEGTKGWLRRKGGMLKRFKARN